VTLTITSVGGSGVDGGATALPVIAYGKS
jgi:hypothetical protein